MMPFCISWIISKIKSHIETNYLVVWGGCGGSTAIWLLFVAYIGGSVRLRTHVGDEPDSFVRVYVDDCLQHLGAHNVGDDDC